MARQPYGATLAYLKMVSFIPLSFYFPHLFLPKSPKSLPFPTFGSPSKHLIKKSCAIPKCSFHASHNVSYSLRQQIPLVWKVIWRAGTIDLILMDFMHGQWGQWTGCPFLKSLIWVPLCHCASVLLRSCGPLMGLWWTDGSSVMWLGAARQGFICPVLSTPCLCLSVLLCGCVDELLPHNLKTVIEGRLLSEDSCFNCCKDWKALSKWGRDLQEEKRQSRGEGN